MIGVAPLPSAMLPPLGLRLYPYISCQTWTMTTSRDVGSIIHPICWWRRVIATKLGHRARVALYARSTAWNVQGLRILRQDVSAKLLDAARKYIVSICSMTKKTGIIVCIAFELNCVVICAARRDAQLLYGVIGPAHVPCLLPDQTT